MIALPIIYSATALACSTFALHTDQGLLFGRNTDGEMAIPGHLVVNRRGIEKQSLPWGFAGPSGKPEDRVRWVSQYGSLTFTHFGREFPDGGVNEAGLIIEEMTLGETEYPQRPSRPTISVQQWIQYQLDNHASVDQVIDDIGRFNLRGWPWHFTVADRQGHCATLEFIDGNAEISRGSLANGCVLTNHRFAAAASQLEQIRSRPEAAMETQGNSSEARFLRANALLSRASPATPEARRDFAFEVLGDIAQGNQTFRSIVYDLAVMKVYFRTARDTRIKVVSLDQLDFSADSPSLALNFDTGIDGEVTAEFTAYNPGSNRATVASVYRLVRATPWASSLLDEELARSGAREDDFINTLARYPDTTHPAGEPH